MSASRVVQGAFLLLLVLQVVWHALLPEPLGNENWILATVAAIPLLALLPGILASRVPRMVRSMTWGAYLLVLYFVLGIMEAWSNPPQLAMALVQVALTLLYFTFLLLLVRRFPKERPNHD